MGTVVIIYFSYLSILLFIYLFIYLFDTTRREHVMIGLFSLHYFFHFSFSFFSLLTNLSSKYSSLA